MTTLLTDLKELLERKGKTLGDIKAVRYRDIYLEVEPTFNLLDTLSEDNLKDVEETLTFLGDGWKVRIEQLETMVGFNEVEDYAIFRVDLLDLAELNTAIPDNLYTPESLTISWNGKPFKTGEWY